MILAATSQATTFQAMTSQAATSSSPFPSPSQLILVSGGASGVDQQAAQFARQHRILCKELFPHTHGGPCTREQLRKEPWRALQGGLVKAAGKELQKRVPPVSRNHRYLLRNAKIAWTTDALLAVSSFERVGRDRRVKGGTGWTVLMSCLLHAASCLDISWAKELRAFAREAGSKGAPLWSFQRRRWWQNLASTRTSLVDKALPIFVWDTASEKWLQAHVRPREQPLFYFRQLEPALQSSADVAELVASTWATHVGVVGSREVNNCEALDQCLQHLLCLYSQ